MTTTQNSPIGTGKFRPLSTDAFNQYAKHLAKLTGDSLSRTRQALARIYGYPNVLELEAALNQQGIPGPFDDEIPAFALELQAVRDAITQRTIRTLAIILEVGAPLYDSGAPPPTIDQLSTLQLFGSPSAHRDGFRQLSLPKTTSAERRAKREAFLSRSEGEQPLIDLQHPFDTTLNETAFENAGPALPAVAPAEVRYGSVYVTHRRRKQMILPDCFPREAEQ